MSQSLLESAIRIYQDEGFTELAKRATRKFLIAPVVDPVYNELLVKGLSQKSFSNEDLLRYSRKEGELYNWNSDLPNINVSPPLSNAIDRSQRTTCVVPQGDIIGNRGLALTEDSQPILQSIKHSDPYFRASVKTAPISTRIDWFISNINKDWGFNLKKGGRNKSAINMVMHTAREHHYGHWLVEYLPKLYHLHQYETETGTEPDIFINNNPPQWMVDSIVALGYSKNRIVEFDYTKNKIQNLLIPVSSLTGNKVKDISFSPVEFQWLRGQYRRKVVKDNSEPDKIYVSRQGLPHRKVANYTELKGFLDDNGFKIVKPEQLKFIEQVESFSNADIIMGGYGSGLHNMLYAKNSNIIEFFPPEYTSSLNHALAFALGHKYESIDGEEEGSKLKTKNMERNEKNHSYHISIEKIRNIIG